MIDRFDDFDMSAYYSLIENIRKDIGGRFNKVINDQIIVDETSTNAKLVFIVMYQSIIESKAIILQKLHSVEKGKGKAKNALILLKSISDKYKLPIYLVSYAFNTDSDEGGLDQEELDKFYQNMGFKFLHRPNKTQMAVYYPL